VLVSEVMLQQTQVSRVVGPWERFLERFPTPATCAAARPGAVVRAWEGLGYNRRALFVHRAAAALVARHDGVVPCDLAALQALPGIGPYTARAVMVFAFERPVAVLDTNVGRVLARAVAARPLSAPEAQALADRLVPRRGAWRHNQALLDVGAAHCTARSFDCTACPLRRTCRWRALGTPQPDPARGSAATSRPQGVFAGSARQGRGRLVAALRRGPLAAAAVATAAGWADDPARASRVADELVAEGMARRGRGGRLELV
jgi:A/G-specific adenine glycosylase